MEAPPKQHFLLMPWLAMGHILPFFQLAKRLADAGISITFLTPPSTPPLSSLSLFHPPTFTLLSPNVVVHDFNLYWLPKTAAEFGVPSVFFSIFTASVAAYFLSHTRKEGNPHVPTAAEITTPPPGFPPSALHLYPFEAEQIIHAYTLLESNATMAHRFLQNISDSDMVIFRSCNEMEGKFLEFLEKQLGNGYKENRREHEYNKYKNIFTVGIQAPRPGDEPPLVSGGEGGAMKPWVEALKWLDGQPDRSVTYVAFGSDFVLTAAQIEAVALGLEASGAPFLWIKRTPRHVELGAGDGLPDRFEDRIEGRGLVVTEWIPQMKVLEHPAVGVFFSHGGISSSIEGLASGQRLVALPIQLDQGINTRLVAEELKVVVEVRRTNLEDGSVSAENVCEAIRRAVSEGDDTETWRNAKDLQERVVHKLELEDQYVQEFIDRVAF
ncbi:hypothetical protein AMTR_s00155p00093050 [Amborella trichopoda]|uniref:Glycosyltransferase n=1 Tax=Amborella trichopoda TaxID=13333 RepID=W1PJ19_AMBTC|nr:hypothetical protein AMTR_s00155p00093050 [Amborella trichopoda]